MKHSNKKAQPKKVRNSASKAPAHTPAPAHAPAHAPVAVTKPAKVTGTRADVDWQAAGRKAWATRVANGNAPGFGAKAKTPAINVTVDPHVTDAVTA